MDYKEALWDDLMEFKLPDPDELKGGALSVNELSRTLAGITNYLVDLSQYEPGLVHKVGELKVDIAEKERVKDQEFQYDFQISSALSLKLIRETWICKKVIYAVS